MSVLGLIVEYNPFHNGHLYHLNQSKVLSGADYTICIMSGNFIQRGEPAIINKWARTKMCLKVGADLVIELPLPYAMASAEFFAYGAVKLLNSLGIVDYICFGSEHGKVDELYNIAHILNSEPELYRTFLKQNLLKGLSYPSSRQQALKDFFCAQDHDIDIDGLIGSSNNILGIEYLKALIKLDSNIRPLTIHRIANAYNDEELTGSISSATSIRKLITKNQGSSMNDLNNIMPDSSLSIMSEEFLSGRGPVLTQNFEEILLSNLRKMSTDDLASILYISEGLHNRIKNAANNSGSLYELIENTMTKRYTRTRIQRALYSSILGLFSNEFEEFNLNGGPQYIRVLGFSKKGRDLLSRINKSADLPVIVKTADFKNSDNRLIRRMLDLEAFSTDIYVLGYKNPDFRKAGQEFTNNVVLLERN